MDKSYVERRNGGYYLIGTRISLDSIVHGFRRGDSPETLCQSFELLTLEDVYGAIAYYLANQAEIDEYLIRRERQWDQERHEAGALPAELKEKLDRARIQTPAS